MSKLFEELDYQPTPIGPISLRRRRILSLDTDVFEVMLGDEHLMSSLFTASEIELARLGLAELSPKQDLDVVVGGLGLGYTASEVLKSDAARSLTVIELLDPVIEWHAKGLVPLEPPLSADNRCRIVQGDFFELAMSEIGFDAAQPERRFDAILIDIDHSPEMLLSTRSTDFYKAEGLRRLLNHLHPGGVMGLWSNDRPDMMFTSRLAAVFDQARAVPVTFDNPLQPGRTVTQTVYLARSGNDVDCGSR